MMMPKHIKRLITTFSAELIKVEIYVYLHVAFAKRLFLKRPIIDADHREPECNVKRYQLAEGLSFT